MRWKSREFLKNREGEQRTRTRFFLVPRMFGPYWYWLEVVLVLEEIKKVDVGGSNWQYVWAWEWRIVDLAMDYVFAPDREE